MERLHKFLASAGVCSRRAAERLIEEGRVQVNGQVVTRLGSVVDAERDAVQLDGKRIRPPREMVYVLLNKPRGYVTTLSDPEGRPTVADLVRGLPGRIFPVGRLDFHSEGLLLLTNDGELAHRLTHPRKAVPKTYLVKVKGQPDRASLRRLSDGIDLDGRRTQPAVLRMDKPGANSWLEVTVVEGRKHLVRRLLDSIGHPVLKLRRTRLGGVRLGALGTGHWRHLLAAEVERLREASTGRPRTRRRRPPRSA